MQASESDQFANYTKTAEEHNMKILSKKYLYFMMD